MKQGIHRKMNADESHSCMEPIKNDLIKRKDWGGGYQGINDKAYM